MMNNVTYKVIGFLKHSELDDFEQGCLSETSTTSFYDCTLEATSIDDLLEAIKHHFDITDEHIELDACDEKGRLDFSVMEDANGDRATDAQNEAFKRGERKLWYCTYSGHLVKQTGGIAWSKI